MEEDTIKDEEPHSHCLFCVKSNCTIRPFPNESCLVKECTNGCGARFHWCKVREHELICKKAKVPCINHIYGCPIVLTRSSQGSHLEKCPASVVYCTMEWNRWPVYSQERSSRIPFIQCNIHAKYGQLDVALALRDQRMLNDAMKVPKSTRRVLRNNLTQRFPAVPLQQHSTLEDTQMEVSNETSRTMSDDEGDSPWNRKNPPGLQRSVCQLFKSKKETENNASDSQSDELGHELEGATAGDFDYDHTPSVCVSEIDDDLSQNRDEFGGGDSKDADQTPMEMCWAGKENEEGESIDITLEPCCTFENDAPGVSMGNAVYKDRTGVLLSIEQMLELRKRQEMEKKLKGMETAGKEPLSVDVTSQACNPGPDLTGPRYKTLIEISDENTPDDSKDFIQDVDSSSVHFIAKHGANCPTDKEDNLKGDLNLPLPPPPELTLKQILSLDMTLESITRYQAKPKSMYTFLCARAFRRDEYQWHFKNIHGEIHAGLNGWLEQRCPLANYGCTFSVRRLHPNGKGSRVVYSDTLESFGIKPKIPDHLQKKLGSSNSQVKPELSQSVKHQEILTSRNYNSALKFNGKSPSPLLSPHDNQPSTLTLGPIDSLTDLPFEILSHIFCFLDGYSLCNLSLTCTFLREVCCSLLEEKGLVIQQWEKQKIGDKVTWSIAFKRWLFSTAFHPVQSWGFEENKHISDHLKECPFFHPVTNGKPYYLPGVNMESQLNSENPDSITPNCHKEHLNVLQRMYPNEDLSTLKCGRHSKNMESKC